MIRALSLLFAFLPAIANAAVTIKAPAGAGMGSPLRVEVAGSSNPKDFLTIVPKGAAAGTYGDYVYLDSPGPKEIIAPGEAGEHELRVLAADSPYPTLARVPLQVSQVAAVLQAPAQVAAGAEFTVRWTGPGNHKDYVAIGDASRPYITYGYTRDANPVRLTAPDAAGSYELRYILGQGDVVIARQGLTVGAVSASVSAPAQVTAGAKLEVKWTGPANAQDYVSLVRGGAPDTDFISYAYTRDGNPARLVVPLVPGDYEIRYQLGQSFTTLARAALKVVPGTQEPGFIQMAAVASKPADRSVEVILDASGSMLQKLGAQRRIEIARQTLAKLVTTTLPAGTPFALRAFGREVNSCRTDLVLALAPLDPAAASKAILALEARNEAKTAIGASLEQVATDLAAAGAARVVIVVTDGEETCGGDPPAVIRRLVQESPGTVVHFVGFAVDDAKLATSFRQWARLGNGSYFDARDGVALERALTQAVQPAFEVLDAAGKVVARGRAGGDAVEVLPGAYRLRLVGAGGAPMPVTVKPKETLSL